MGNSQSSKKQSLEIDRSKSQLHEDWTIYSGNINNSAVTVFSSVHPTSSKKRGYIDKALQFSKIYRHPGILKYVDGGTNNEEVTIVTEKTTSLLQHGLEQMSSLELTAGMLSILEALVFLHDKAGVSHNNIGPSSIFIATDGTWKLWCFEYSCSFGDLTKDTIERINQYCNPKVIPPDEKEQITPAYQHARDCYAFAKFVVSITENRTETEFPFLRDFVDYLNTCALVEDWTKRVRLASVLEHNFFKHDFLKLCHDVTHALLLPDDQRDQLIKALPKRMQLYPECLVASSLLPTLLSRPILYLDSSREYLMPVLMVPKDLQQTALFSAQTFKQFMVPLIVTLFTIYDSTIRYILLKYFKYYIGHIDKNILTKDILPQLLLGIKDVDDHIVSETLEALSKLVPILGASIVVGTNREKVFSVTKKSVNIETKNIPERSAPDGGEVIGEDSQLDDNWEDWEDDETSRRMSCSSVTSRESTKELGEELVIKPVQIDQELDLFADLKPQLKENTFNLESMLMKACDNQKPQSSIAHVLAGTDDIEDGWGDDSNTSD